MRSEEEIREVLREHLAAIESSASRFDAGEMWEAKRIANSVYTLVHDTQNNTSVLAHLGRKNKMKYLATGRKYSPSEKRRFQSPPLVKIVLGPNGMDYRARLGESEKDFRWLDFRTWWEEDPVYWYEDRDSEVWSEITLSRRELVRSITDQDGGRHLDKELKNRAYAHMKSNPGWVNIETGLPPQLFQELVTVRQIGWELAKSISQ